MSLLERIAARNPQPEPDTRPEWLRRGEFRKDFSGRVLVVDASPIDAADRAAARRLVVEWRKAS